MHNYNLRCFLCTVHAVWLPFKTTTLGLFFHLKDEHPEIVKLKMHYSYIQHRNGLTKNSLNRADGFFTTHETLWKNQTKQIKCICSWICSYAYNVIFEVSEIVCVLCTKHTCYTYIQHLGKDMQKSESIRKLTLSDFFIIIFYFILLWSIISYKDIGWHQIFTDISCFIK